VTEPSIRNQLYFGADPANYDAARPPYPERVYQLLRQRCGLGGDGHSTAVVEIGPGTGLATRRLIAQGADPFVVIEPDERLARFLTEALGEAVEVRIEPFEQTTLPAGSFDLVVAATAFHWLEQEAALAQAGRILRRGGWLALWWNLFGDPVFHDAFHEATTAVLPPLLGPSAAPGTPFALDVAARAADIAASGLFEPAEHEILYWESRMDSGEIRALYATFPHISSLPTPERDRVLDDLARIARDEFHGEVKRTFATAIYTARRR